MRCLSSLNTATGFGFAVAELKAGSGPDAHHLTSGVSSDEGMFAGEYYPFVHNIRGLTL